MSSSKTFILRSSEGDDFEVQESEANLSLTIQKLTEDDCGGFIPISKCNSKTLVKVIEYCKKHVDESCSKEDLKAFDAKFIDIDTEFLYDVTLAAHYLDIEDLLELATQKVADLIKGKTVEQIRKTFNIKNDLTPEEEAQIRREHPYGFPDN